VPFPEDDLKYAKTVQRAGEVSLVNGETLFTGVHEVNEEEGFVTFYAPQTFGDATTRKVPLDLIASLTVTDVE
jgi:hypothetical protein